MKSVLLINQYFWPDMAATAQLLSDLAEDLAIEGFAVSVLTGKGTYALSDARALPARETWKQVEIRRVWCTNRGRSSLIGRVLDYGTFFLSAATTVVFGRRHDIVVCLSTPPLIALLGLLAKLRSSRFVYKVEDLYPDLAIALGVFGERSLAARFFGWLSRLLLERADSVVALDGSMEKALRARGAQRVVVIPNWADGEAIRPDREAGERFRSCHELIGRFVVLYSGNLGKAHRFDAVIEAARQLEKSLPQVLFLFVGAGPRLDEVRKATDGLKNVRFLPYQPRELLNEVFNAADAHLVTLRPEVAGLLVPSKYSSALAAGKPVLLVGGVGTGLHTEVQRENVGWCCDHEPRSVQKALRQAVDGSLAPEASGCRARSLFERKYGRNVSCGRWSALLSELDSPPSGRQSTSPDREP